MRKTLAVLSCTAVSLLALALPASAHVTVHSYDAVSGGDDALLDFRVPNEEAKAATTKLEIALPADEPIAGIYAEAKPGWKAVVTSTKLATPIVTDDGKITSAVSTVVWTATAGGIPVGGYDDFTLAAGHLPTAKSITFKALQTYSDGTVVAGSRAATTPSTRLRSWTSPRPARPSPAPVRLSRRPRHPHRSRRLATAPPRRSAAADWASAS